MGGRDPRSPALGAGALIAIEGADRRIAVLLHRAFERGARCYVPAGALGQAWRRGPRQTRLGLLLEDPAVSVEPLDQELAKAAGELCGRRGTDDVIDASVALTSRRTGSVVLTGDPDHLRRLDPRLDIVAI